ncbi:cytidylate kinase [Fusarium albosuccineum]|uniref:Cytidylate kinase n=1 Tax=Fusarium albosuccineum TaxID=1237068 RepID=A0A8H4PAW6_9HYPO|nr:cytidylate kinase [Fusarium albosuccineum]
MGLSFENEPPALARVLSNLNMIDRAGWLKRGVPSTDCEKVGDHTAGVVALVRAISAKRPDVDSDKACDMAVCHDYAEVYTGDITPYDGVLPEAKQSGEDDAYIQFSKIDPERGQRIWKLGVEYRENGTPEAQLVKSADKYQRLEKAWEYQRRYPKLDFSGFREDQALICDPELKELADKIIQEWDAYLRPVFIFVIGPPGVGKGTQCEQAVKQDNRVIHLSAGDLLRAAAKNSQSALNSRAATVLKGLDPSPPDLIIELIQDALSTQNARVVLLDGFPYNEEQYHAFRNMANAYTIEFTASRQILESRLAERSLSSGRQDDKDDARRKSRLDGYEARGFAIALRLQKDSPEKHFKINAERPKDEVAVHFRGVLDTLLAP